MKQLIPLLIFLLMISLASAHEAYLGLIGKTVVELAPNYISPIIRENYTAEVAFVDSSGNATFPTFNVLIYNETEKIFEIDNLKSSFGKITSFSYVFEKEGNYFIVIQNSDGQTDFPIYARAPNISGLFIILAAGITALIGFFVGKFNLLKPVEEEIEVIEGKKKKPRRS